MVDGYDYTRSTNIAQVGLRKPLETLGFIGVSRNAYRAHVRPIGGTCQAWHARAKRDAWRGRGGRGAQIGARDRRTCQGGHVSIGIGAHVARAS